MYPILFRFGSTTIYAYTAALVLGMVAGLAMALYLARKRFDIVWLLDAGFWALLGGIVGGRIGYVVVNSAYFAEHPGETFALWEGGLRWNGALLGGILFMGLWYTVQQRIAQKQDKPDLPAWWDLLDTAAPGIALGCAFGWLGCLLTGSAYGLNASGYAAPVAWLAADLPDIFGVWEVRFATQPLMGAWCLGLWGLLWWAQRLRRGLPSALWLGLYALADFGVAFLRGDGTWRFGLWLSQWVALAGCCLAVGLVLYLTRKVKIEHAC